MPFCPFTRAVFFYRLGEMRDRSFENQNYRASGLNLVVAAIILWNAMYLERSIITQSIKHLTFQATFDRFLAWIPVTQEN